MSRARLRARAALAQRGAARRRRAGHRLGRGRIELLRLNAERNGVLLRLARVRWSEPNPLLRAAPWDLVLGADLLYEARNAEQLAELLPELGGEVLLAEPGRPYAKELLERFQAEPVGERIYRLAC